MRDAANVQRVARCKAHGIAACTVCNPKAAYKSVRGDSAAATVYFEVVHDDGEALEVVIREEYDRLRDALMIMRHLDDAGERERLLREALRDA